MPNKIDKKSALQDALTQILGEPEESVKQAFARIKEAEERAEVAESLDEIIEQLDELNGKPVEEIEKVEEKVEVAEKKEEASFLSKPTPLWLHILTVVAILIFVFLH